jgi:putative transposase
MSAPSPHRKRVRHYDLRGHAHELTFSCYRRLPLLTDDWRREQLARAIDNATVRHGWRLTAFVFMPEHVHLIVLPTDSASTVDALLFAVKRPFSYRIKQQLQQSNPRLLDELTIRQRPGKATFRFWQEGPGYDRNLTNSRSILAAIDYLHANPVRRRLCEHASQWRWSSAHWYETDGETTDPALPRLAALPAGTVYVGCEGELPI